MDILQKLSELEGRECFIRGGGRRAVRVEVGFEVERVIKSDSVGFKEDGGGPSVEPEGLESIVEDKGT
jgi:hypothetical protein